ncbi:MAG TPA: hypothetical protein VGX52_10465, partial [Burkholderiales bacterium]|nr:hypothetical protein [Burkholderiales bacterium]
MKRRTLGLSLAGIFLSALTGAALAAPAPYTFSTAVLTTNNPFSPNGVPLTPEQFAISSSIASQLAGTTISGTFVYDNQAPFTG